MILKTPADSQVTTFRGPQDVLVGDGSVERVGEVTTRWIRPGRLLVVSDAHLAQIGVVAVVADALEKTGFTVEVFDDVVGEPDVDSAERVAGLARERAFEGVVGLGGGSALDLAKIASAAAANEMRVVEFVGVDALQNDPKPMVLIPTTAGTGSEATHIAMISVDGTKRIINDYRLVPRAAVLDATLTISLPRPVTAATGLDALAHAIESRLSRNANLLTAAMSAEAVRLLSRWLPLAHGDGENLEARRATLYGAHLAGLALNAGTILGHAIAYTIANRTQLAHGVTCAMALPYCLGYALWSESVGSKLTALASDVADQTGTASLSLLAWIEQINESFRVPPGLETVGISAEELETMASECMELYPRPNNPVPLERERLMTMYRYLWAGDAAGYVDDVLAGTKGS